MADPQRSADSPPATRAWHGMRGRLLGGLLLILPILITLWTIVWLYLTLKQLVIDP